MAWRRAAVCAALLLWAGTVPVAAQDVTLTSRDGVVEIDGTLLGYDGEFYRVETIYGELTVDGSGVNCEGPGCPNLEDFVADIPISGSAAMGAVLMPVLLEGFAQRHGYQTRRVDEDPSHFHIILTETERDRTAAVFRFRVSNSEEGFADLLANEADMVMSYREILPQERDRALEAGLGDLTHRNRSLVLALDAIVPVVAPQNPVREISPLDLARVYSGEIVNWADLGGPDAPVALHAPTARSGLAQAAEAGILRPSNRNISPDVVRHERGDTLATAVERDPFALGLVSFAEVGQTQTLVLKGRCGRVLAATRRSIKTEDYPLTAPMFLYTPARRLPRIGREFLAFVRTLAAQGMIRRAGFVDQAPEEVPINEQGDRFANAIASAGPEVPLSEVQRMVDRLRPMNRLTISFRFEPGSVRLDAQSQSNITQLAHDLEQGWYDARAVYFIGFSDGDGPAEQNRQIALTRAEAVRAAVMEAAETVDPAQVDLRVDAFGEAMPLACDDSAWGRKANRRVEVWVR